jgi:hypothetical protein
MRSLSRGYMLESPIMDVSKNDIAKMLSIVADRV